MPTGTIEALGPRSTLRPEGGVRMCDPSSELEEESDGAWLGVCWRGKWDPEVGSSSDGMRDGSKLEEARLGLGCLGVGACDGRLWAGVGVVAPDATESFSISSVGGVLD